MRVVEFQGSWDDSPPMSGAAESSEGSGMIPHPWKVLLWMPGSRG